MPAYQNGARRTRATDAALIIADAPTIVTREREVHADQYRDPTLSTAGPFTVRISEFRTTRMPVVFDEKGTGGTTPFVLLAVAIPRLLPDNSKSVMLADTLVDTDGNRYLVTSPPRWGDGVIECNLELRG